MTTDRQRGRTHQFIQGVKLLLVFLPMAAGLSLWFLGVIVLSDRTGDGMAGLVGILIGVLLGAAFVLGGTHGTVYLSQRWGFE